MDKHLGDGLSIMTAIATLIGWLPSISALVTIVWVCIRIYETNTVQTWLGRKTTVIEDEHF
jgi:DMSO reductase anchor subunit